MNSDKNFLVQLIGDTGTINGFHKTALNEQLERFIETFEETFNQAKLVVDVTYKKGHHMKGRHEGIPLVDTKIRFQTDKGNFFAEKENFGINSAVHDTLHTLTLQIREHFSRMHPKLKGNPMLQDWNAIEA